ncbi:MAG: phosphoribosylformylglycinamidine synthase subunit PurS [Ignavibacteria bacterium]|nr:phosphoribosylformylglycinamidine synthase subunit PurS [Ignavibacteria bacterium]
MQKFNAKVKVMLKKGILDVQGKTVENSLKTLGFDNIANIRIGKFITFDVEADTIEKAKEIANSAVDKLLYNPNIETYYLEIESIEGNI